MREFAERELFNPLHMANVTMEFDGRGVFVGSSYVYAPASVCSIRRALLDDGVAPDGHRILPEGWVAWSRRAVLGSAYGTGFWTNDGPNEFAAWRVEQGFPRDGFYADGHLGQRIYIVPSEHIVIARFGYSRTELRLAEPIPATAGALRKAGGHSRGILVLGVCSDLLALPAGRFGGGVKLALPAIH
jgi:CubicO group peptidase (beta-lactamase class C family)